jgi:xylulokinase
MYTKSWSAFDRLVAIVPPGGSIGSVLSWFLQITPPLNVFLFHSLDDKLFSYWLLQGDSYPYSHVKGIFRFETGIKVNEFRDLRANPRCLLESQILAFRVKWARMIATGVLGTRRSPAGAAASSPASASSPSAPTRPVSTSLGLSFDPYDCAPLPTRVLTTGAAANFPSVANLVGDIFNAPVFAPTTQVDAAQIAPHRNSPAPGFPGRAALGAAYVARWVWAKESATPGGGRGLGGFEEEIRRLLGKRWVASGGVPLRTNINGLNAGSGANSGTSTPYGHPGRSGLGSTVFVEEDEDEVEEMEQGGDMSTVPGIGSGNSGYLGPVGDMGGRLRTQTSSTTDTTTSFGSAGTPSTAMTTPDLGTGGVSPSTHSSSNASGVTAPNSSTTTKLTPIMAMPTADLEAQIGLAKVAEPDTDAFLTYASIVPEYCRLEGVLVKGLV